MKEKELNNNIKEWYLANYDSFVKSLNGQSKTFMTGIRKEAVDKLRSIEFPTLKDEDWKYTNIKPILNHNFVPPRADAANNLPSGLIDQFLFRDFDHYLMVFVNGIFSKELSDINDLPKGVIVESLNNIVKENPSFVESYIKKGGRIDNGFNALNMMYSRDGAVVMIPDNVILEKPIQALYLSGDSESNILSAPRNIIVAGKNSRLKFISNHRGIDSKPYFSNNVTDIFTDESAAVDYYKILDDNDDAYHIERTQVHQKNKSIFSHFSLSFGSAIGRNDLSSVLDGENIECNYYGLYLAHENQHIDNHTFVDHAKPNSLSNELYKGILDDESQGVFSGKIMVRQDAQKTNAYQSNKTVLLSKKANIDTKPQLEIYADDVKCSHGATVGHLDDTAYFYVRSRGIPAELAKSMLIRAFVSDVVEKIKIEALRDQINHMIFNHLHRVEIK